MSKSLKKKLRIKLYKILYSPFIVKYKKINNKKYTVKIPPSLEFKVMNGP
jgi:hypothetical protein